MLPNLSLPSFDVYGLFKIEPFAVLLAIAVLICCELAYRRARSTHLNGRLMVDGILWAILVGFAVSHWVAMIFNYPEQVVRNPLVLLMFWSGFSSFGGFLGGFLGAFIYFKTKNIAVMPYLEAMLFGLVPAWIIVRLGCTIVFDHPGRQTDFILGMVDQAGLVRHNLGFYEMLLAIFLTTVLYALRNVKPFEGFHLSLMIIIYAPMRIFFDTLQLAEKTYLGFTPGQYFAFVFLSLGLYLLLRGLQRQGSNAQVSKRKDGAL